MNRHTSRPVWIVTAVAGLGAVAALGLGIRQEQVSGQDKAPATAVRTAGIDTQSTAPGKTPDELKRDPAVEHAYGLSRAFRESAKTAMPSVVKVYSHQAAKKVKTQRGENGLGDNPMFRGGNNPFKGTPFEDMFPQGPGGDFSGSTPERDGMGSGVIIDKTGIVLTNNHVVDGADKVTVHLSDGRDFVATDIKTDPRSDLAVVRFKPDSDLPVAHLGNSDDLEIGDWVIAIGNPFDQEKTVTAGIISGKGRELHDMTRMHGPKFIQTDAAINPGNSGGPLVNLAGEVVGINTAIATNSGGYQGIGFAIPINQARWVTDQLVKDGAVHRGYLGVQIGEVTDAVAKKYGAPKGQGAIVGDVFRGSPAADAKLQEDDIIEKFAGQTVHSSRELPELVEQAQLNKPQPLEVLRDGKTITLNVTVKSMPEKYGMNEEEVTEEHSKAKSADSEFNSDDLGLKVSDLTGDASDTYKGYEGVVVTNVEPESVAAEKGLRPGILIRKVGKTTVHNVKEFEAAMKHESLKDGILLHVRTPGGHGAPAGNGMIVLSQEK